MSIDSNLSQDLIKLLLPEEIFEYFDIVDVKVKKDQVDVFLDEKNIIPEEYSETKATSKGFHAVATVRDFPIRDKSMFLHIRRRRWLIESSGQVVSRNWELVAKGTRFTKDFAAFLKGLHGQIPDKF